MAALLVVLGAAAAANDVLMIAVDDLRPQLACTDVPGTVRPTMQTPHICGFANDSLVLLRSQVAISLLRCPLYSMCEKRASAWSQKFLRSFS